MAADKPDWCEQRIWDAAKTATGAGGGHEMQGYVQSVRENVARLLMAEAAKVDRPAAEGAEMTDWMVRINEGPPQPFSTRTGLYQDAAVAAYAMLPYEERAGRQVVEIWSPRLLPDYGPYFYGMEHDECGHRRVAHLIPVRT